VVTLAYLNFRPNLGRLSLDHTRRLELEFCEFQTDNWLSPFVFRRNCFSLRSKDFE